MNTWSTSFLGCAVLAACLVVPRDAVAGEPELAGMAEQLARLRADLEGLDAKLDDQRESRRTQLRALGAQKAAIELELQREELRAQQLGDRLTRTRDRQRAADARRGQLTGAIGPAVDALASGVRSGLPFRIDERVSALDALGKELGAGLSAGDALGKLWSWVDAEVALARTTGIHPQVVKLGQEEVMADLARVGLVVLYARTADGRLAVARSEGEAWAWSLIEAPAEQEQVRALYAALEKDGDQGFFTLPRPFSKVALSGGSR